MKRILVTLTASALILALSAFITNHLTRGALAQWATGTNYTEQGGTRSVIQGTLDVVSGGELDIESGGALAIAGTAITATAAEINASVGGAFPGDVAITSDTTIGETLIVAGATTLTGAVIAGAAVSVTGALTAATIDGSVGSVTPAAGAFTTGTLAGLVLASDEYIGRFTYSADPNGTTATLTATNVLIGDYVIGGAQSGSANGTYKNLQGATPQNGSILLTFEVDPGAAVTYSFLVFR